MTRLLLYAQDSDIRKAYQSALQDLNVAFDAISSFSQMFEELPQNEYSGLLMDVASSIRATPAEKSLIQEVMDIYPSLRLQWDGRTGEIKTLAYGKGCPSRTSLEDFIDARCRPFEARPLRFEDRAMSNCHVLLSSREDFPPQQTQKTVTINLSRGGCFLFSADRWQDGHEVWLRFPGMEDDTPIRAEVRWSREWGKGPEIPGIGVKFLQLGPGQAEEIEVWSK